MMSKIDCRYILCISEEKPTNLCPSPELKMVVVKKADKNDRTWTVSLETLCKMWTKTDSPGEQILTELRKKRERETERETERWEGGERSQERKRRPRESHQVNGDNTKLYGNNEDRQLM